METRRGAGKWRDETQGLSGRKNLPFLVLQLGPGSGLPHDAVSWALP